jgi:hypothetical protein
MNRRAKAISKINHPIEAIENSIPTIEGRKDEYGGGIERASVLGQGTSGTSKFERGGGGVDNLIESPTR